MGQLSFFSAEATPPAVTDLSGLLAGPGQMVSGGAGARISVVVDESWRARAVAELIEDAGLSVETTRSEEGRPLVRTSVVPELAALAREWTRGAVKAVPETWVPDARELRMWAVAAGYGEHDGDRFVLGLDPHAPDSHPQLALALLRAGIAPTLIGTRGPRPGLRIAGRRRLMRLAECIGEPPADAGPSLGWPRF